VDVPGPDVIHARAHAKINLALAVGPPRPPGGTHAGYHPIASWMHAIDLHDEITLTHAAETRYDLAWANETPIEWALDADLCVRAHRALEALTGRTLPILLRVRKSIPAGGGLGGGSADAGAVLLALRELFALELSDGALAACAHALGTDIPFFVDPEAWRACQSPRPAIVSGLGDRIERTVRRSDPLTLICPPFGCPTGAVYRAFDAEPTQICDEATVRALAAGPIDPHALFNDLAGPAERVEPRLQELRTRLVDALGLPVHVSGSGSTLFCFERAEAVRPHAPGCRVISTALV
jgi:4-diphosphocytidyl-2-C-methyl-D-erythritol kinase